MSVIGAVALSLLLRAERRHCRGRAASGRHAHQDARMVEKNRMTPSSPHVPLATEKLGTGASVLGGPPSRARRFSARPAKKPIDRPSGESANAMG